MFRERLCTVLLVWYNRDIEEGGVAEWSNALVLKTRVSKGTVSSNLTPSAMSNVYTGIVQEGQRRAAALGFPTVNIPCTDVNVSGIYIAYVIFQNKQYPAAAFVDQKRRILEAHVLDANLDLYGKEITIGLLEKIRDNQQFENDETLKFAIAEDIGKVRKYFERKI